VPVFAPTGELGDIPAERLRDAVKAGFQPGVHVQSADGQDGVIPAPRTADAVKAGMKVVPIEDQPIQHSGFWSALGEDLGGMLKGIAPPTTKEGLLAKAKMFKEAITGPDPRETVQSVIDRANAGYGPAYSALAPTGEQLGVNVKGMEQSAQQGEVGGVMGHAAAVPTALAGTLAGTELLGRLPIGRITKAAGGAIKGAAKEVPIVSPIARGAIRGAAKSWQASAPTEAAPPFQNPGAPYPTATSEQLNPALISPARTIPGMNPPEVTGRPTPGPIQGPGRGLMLPGEVPATGKLSDLVAAPSAERIPAVRDPSTILPRLRAIAKQIEAQEAKVPKDLEDLTGEVQASRNQVIDNKVLDVLGKVGKGGLQVSLETLQKSPELNRFTPEELQESAVRLRDAGRIWRQEIGGGAHATRYVVSLRQ
jgi:hypothetical protein